MKKIKILYVYCLSIVCISVIAILFLPKPIKNFVPMITLFNFPVLFFMAFYRNFDLSHKIKLNHPEIFSKHKFDNGISIISGEIISILTYFGTTDFDKLGKEVKEESQLIKKLFLCSILCFVLGTVLAIWTVYL
jgi:hypothetical protein